MSDSIGRIGARRGVHSPRAVSSPARARSLATATGVLELGDQVEARLEMMSSALWVRDQLVACGWQVQVADARKVKTVAPLAAKTDKVDARLLAELCRRELVPALWLPSLDERGLRERLRRRMHLVRLRTSAKARIAGLQTQWGVRVIASPLAPG
jgi:transposase